MEIYAKKAREERITKEKEEKEWQHILDKMTVFLKKYPYDEFLKLNNEIQDLKEKKNDYTKTVDEKQKERKSLEQQIGKYKDKLNYLEQESIKLGSNIKRALQYFNEKKEKEALEILRYEKKEDLKNVDNEILLNKKHKKSKEYIIQEIILRIQEIKNHISNLLDDTDYKQVVYVEPKYTTMNKQSILEERKYIKDMLDERQKGRHQIERDLSNYNKLKKQNEEFLSRKYTGAKYFIDENTIYPYNGKELIAKLTEKVKVLTTKVDSIEPILRQKEKNYDDKKIEYDIRKDDFNEIFKEIMVFNQHLQQVKLEISQEEVDLKSKEDYINSNKNKLSSILTDVEKSIKELEIKNAKYEFLSERIEEAILSNDIKQSLPYKREEIISKLVQNLEDLTIIIEKHRSIVGREKNEFLQFCNANVKDVRLREMVVLGIRKKDDFYEILEWQKSMVQTLNKVIRIAERHMMEHDKELSQFIHYLYIYLCTLADEIREIPKNTKVKINDSWKEIFQIDVPKWDEEEGKEEIRKHVDWITNRLESDEFLDDEGKQNEALIRKSIEKWLQSKQLLKNLIGGREIKVKCRKVTNDGEVSSMHYSWETSNKWSGGEKWSKNMALFLGILNYVAEKRQHIVPSQKRHRTVIMDNPFGKASSEHVLSPVFFIAEQLGFQFIALTAHGEGKFIRDYFPIVYSCKLRSSLEGDTSILIKDKIINYAFFRDNDPMTIERIGKREQLSMFEL